MLFTAQGAPSYPAVIRWQAALVSLILRRTASRTGVVYRDECEREPWTLVDGGIDQCFMYWMARLGSPYGNRTVTRGVHFVHPAGADFQASALR